MCPCTNFIFVFCYKLSRNAPSLSSSNRPFREKKYRKELYIHVVRQSHFPELWDTLRSLYTKPQHHCLSVAVHISRSTSATSQISFISFWPDRYNMSKSYILLKINRSVSHPPSNTVPAGHKMNDLPCPYGPTHRTIRQDLLKLASNIDNVLQQKGKHGNLSQLSLFIFATSSACIYCLS